MTDRKKPDRKNSTSSEVNRYLKRRENLIFGLENESFLVSESDQSTNMSKDSIFLDFLERKEKTKKPVVKRRLFQTDVNNVEVRSNNSADSQVRRNLLRKSKPEAINIEVDKSEISLVEIPEEELKNGLSKEILQRVDQNVSLINASFRKNRFKPLENVKVVRGRPKPKLKKERKRTSAKKDGYWRESPIQTRGSQTLRNELKSVQEVIVPEPMDIIYISSEEKPIEPVNCQFSWEKQNEEFSSLELPQVVMTPQNWMSQQDKAELLVISQENDSQLEVPSPIFENLPIGSQNPPELPIIFKENKMKFPWNSPLDAPKPLPSQNPPEHPDVVVTPEILPEPQSKNEERPEEEDFFDPPRNEIEVLRQSLKILSPIEKEDCSPSKIKRMELPTPDLFTLSSENPKSLEPEKKVVTPMMEEVPVVVPDKNVEALAEKTHPMIEEVVHKPSSPPASLIKEFEVGIPEKPEILPIPPTEIHVSVIVPLPVVEPVKANPTETKIQETVPVPAETKIPEPEPPKTSVEVEKKSNLPIFYENRLVSIHQPQIKSSLDSHLFKRPEPPKVEKLVSIHQPKVSSSLKRPEKLVSIHQPRIQSSLDSHLFKRPEPPKMKTKPKERESPYAVKPFRPKTFGEKEKNVPVQKELKKSRSAIDFKDRIFEAQRLKRHFKKTSFFVEKIPVFKERVLVPEPRKEIVLKRCDRIKRFDRDRVLKDEKWKRSQGEEEAKKSKKEGRKEITGKFQSIIANEKKDTETIHEKYKQLKKDSERRLERIRKLVPLSAIIKRNELKQNYLNKLSAKPTVFTAPRQKEVEKWILADTNDDPSESLPIRLKDFDSVASAIDLW